MSKVIAVVEAHYSRTLFEKFWGLTRVTSDRSDTWCAVCLLSRSSHQRCSRKLAFLRILQNSLETPVLDSPFYKILGLRLASFLKKRLWYRCFPVNFAIFQELFFIEHLRVIVSDDCVIQFRAKNINLPYIPEEKTREKINRFKTSRSFLKTFNGV